MSKKHYAHFGRPITAQHRKRISATLKARNKKIREALSIAETVGKTGVFVATDDRRENER